MSYHCLWENVSKYELVILSSLYAVHVLVFSIASYLTLSSRCPYFFPDVYSNFYFTKITAVSISIMITYLIHF